jgi:protein associated with RNAse G/E
MFHPTDAPYSVWLFFQDGQFTSWYVNLERAGARWVNDDGLVGLDTIDYDLDIVAAPDRSWRWKDEHEFAGHLLSPETYWVDDEQAVRTSGAEVVKLIEAGDFPFDGTMTDFRPDPRWTVPTEFPAGWDRPRAW